MLLALAGIGAVAGCLGAIAGTGGGILIVPALAILFRFDIHAAIVSWCSGFASGTFASSPSPS